MLSLYYLQKEARYFLHHFVEVTPPSVLLQDVLHHSRGIPPLNYAHSIVQRDMDRMVDIFYSIQNTTRIVIQFCHHLASSNFQAQCLVSRSRS